MPFVRILLLIVAVLAVGVIGLAILRPDPEVPAPQAESAPPPVTRPVPAPAPREPQIMSPADASSPAEITAREAAEAQRRLEKEQQESPMMTPDMRGDDAPVEMMPPGDPPAVK